MGWLFFDGILGLAGSIIDIWRTRQESRERALDRQHAVFLMDMQHRHERMLAGLHQGRTATIDVPVIHYGVAAPPLPVAKASSVKRAKVKSVGSAPPVALQPPVETARVIMPPVETDEYMRRLTVEAQALSDAGYDVVFESVEDGYCVALPVGDSTLVLWFGRTWPEMPPLILFKTGDEIDRIFFADDAWSPDQRAITAVQAIACEV